MLFNDFVNKCHSVLKPNCSDPVCLDSCKQAIDNLYNDDNGFKLKCCDCRSPNQQVHMTTVHFTLLPEQCFMERSRLIKYCTIDHNDCISCKERGKLL